MNSKILFYVLILFPFIGHAQTYEDGIRMYRLGYKMTLVKGQDSLKHEDTGYIQFYEPDSNYRVKAVYDRTTGTTPFKLPTVNGETGPMVKDVGIVYFNMNGAAVTLHVFRILTKPRFRVMARKIDVENDNVMLFIPFYDNTNYNETFEGGRYLDVSAAALASGTITLDFNKAYNPFGAYQKKYPYLATSLVQEDFSPMDAGVRRDSHNVYDGDRSTKKLVNTIRIDIKAGEKKMSRHPKYK